MAARTLAGHSLQTEADRAATAIAASMLDAGHPAVHRAVCRRLLPCHFLAAARGELLGRADGSIDLVVPLRCQVRPEALQRVAGTDAEPAAEGAA